MSRVKRRNRGRAILAAVAGLAFLLATALAFWEARTSRIQARIFSRITAGFTYRIGDGESSAIRFPSHGPYDLRLGYVRIPEWRKRLSTAGYGVSAQARWSVKMTEYADKGVFPTYSEKTQAGMAIYDHRDRAIMRTPFPQRVYQGYGGIPPVLVRMLLYIENRDLLSASSPYKNPAVDWKRQGKAVSDGARRLLDANHRVIGGSTLATQIEKFRHSPEGITTDAREKVRQILSASLRAYRGGEMTRSARESIILDYINSIPLAATPGYGEVIGLGDGLWAWYGMDFETVSALLWEAESTSAARPVDPQIGAAVRAALSLFLAQRRPSTYLLMNRGALRELSASYLRRMAQDGMITSAVRDAALAAEPPVVWRTDVAHGHDPPLRRAAAAVRSRLLPQLGIDRLYDLDRLDLDVLTTLDLDLHEAATNLLAGLGDQAQIRQAGLVGPHLLEKGDPAQVVYSFSLYEAAPEGNLLRVQTSTFDGALNIDEQAKLDLGSSAKLRTLVHYLEIIAYLHRSLGAKTARGPHSGSPSRMDAADPLTHWAIEYLRDHPAAELSTMLTAAMARSYSASPTERFFTGGGVHTFSNFNRADNSRVMPVGEAFRNSVNLVFVRLMRDIVHYHVYQRYGATPAALERIDDAEKRRLLQAFADREGIVFIRRFYDQYRGKTPEDARKRLFEEIRPGPARLSAVFRYLTPEATVQSLAEFLGHHLPDSKLADEFVRELHASHAPGKLTLASIGYKANIHPLELWVVRYLQGHPEAHIQEVIDASGDVRQDVYQWLFKTRSRRTQLQRIRTIVELEAFHDIHQAWHRLGYPFDYLIPSYATTLGSSADRPAALAELCGIIMNDGLRRPMIRIRGLHFGCGTPYETRMEQMHFDHERVLPEAVARAAREAMLDVVRAGTARRLQNGIELSGGRSLTIGGKTGTGDHRYRTFGLGGRLIGDRVVNRAATFVFLAGDRFFGTITAYVGGEAAADYVFSSSLPVQILKTLLTNVAPLLDREDESQPARAGLPEAVPAQSTE